MGKIGASIWQMWTIVHEEKQDNVMKRFPRKVLKEMKLKSQSRPRQFGKACLESYKRRIKSFIPHSSHHLALSPHPCVELGTSAQGRAC
jgi:hypothetical protein